MISVLDTSCLWSLIDLEDENHDKILKWIKPIAIGEICILPNVEMEFMARYKLEYNKLLAGFLFRVENSNRSKFSLSDVNIIVDQVANELKNQRAINTQKLNKYRINLHESCHKAFISKSKTELSKRDLKEEILSMKDRSEGQIIGSLRLLMELGFDFPNVSGESINKMAKQIIDKGIKFEGTGDSMIAGELLCLLTSDIMNKYQFVSLDANFSKLLGFACKVLNIGNVEVLLIK